MKHTLVGDPHCKPDNLEKVAKLLDMCEDLGNPVIILGDLFDTKEVVRGRCLNLILEKLQKSKLQWTILVGNHDYFNLECKEHSLEALKILKNVNIVDNKGQYTPGKIGYLPYIHDQKILNEAIDKMNKDYVHILIAHLAVTGFDYGNGIIEQNGLDLKALKKFKLVISGHFHCLQEKGNLIYLGTPFSHSFGESNQEKIIAILDDEREEIVEIIETPFPKHITLEMDCDKSNDLKPKLKDINYKENYVRVILKGKESSINKVKKDDFPEIKFIERAIEDDTQKVKISETQSNPEKFVEWAEQIKNLDSSTIKLGLQFLAEADNA